MSTVEELREALENYWRKEEVWFDARWYTPEEWAATSARFGKNSVLNLTFEGPLYSVLNGDDSYATAIENKSHEIAESQGYWWEMGYAWSLHFYPIAEPVLPVKEQPLTIPARDSRLDESVDDQLPYCINCALPKSKDARWRKLIVASVSTDGVMETLEEWPLCPDCESSRQATLTKYVALVLA